MSRQAPPIPPTADTDCASARDDLAAYALGVLDAEDADAVERHLSACASCRAELDGYETVTDALGGAVDPELPSPALRRRLVTETLETAYAAPMDRPVDSGHASPPTPARRWAIPPLAAVAYTLAASLLLVGLAVTSVLLQQTRSERDTAREGQSEVAEYLQDGGTITPLAPTRAIAGSGCLIVAPDQPRALLMVYDLAPTDKRHQYRAWVARGATRTELDEFRVTPEGSGWLIVEAPDPLTTYDTVGIALLTPGAPAEWDFLVAPLSRSSPR